MVGYQALSNRGTHAEGPVQAKLDSIVSRFQGRMAGIENHFYHC